MLAASHEESPVLIPCSAAFAKYGKGLRARVLSFCAVGAFGAGIAQPTKPDLVPNAGSHYVLALFA
jgi:hypothetical protein